MEKLIPHVPGGIPSAYPEYRPDRPPGPSQITEQATLDRRIAEDKAHHERGFPVAGHDFVQEREERTRDLSR